MIRADGYLDVEAGSIVEPATLVVEGERIGVDIWRRCRGGQQIERILVGVKILIPLAGQPGEPLLVHFKRRLGRLAVRRGGEGEDALDALADRHLPGIENDVVIGRILPIRPEMLEDQLPVRAIVALDFTPHLVPGDPQSVPDE